MLSKRRLAASPDARVKGGSNVSRLDYGGECFYIHAMELFSKAGHAIAPIPEFINHSPEQFVYFDSNFDVSLSKDQRAMFRMFNNISRLFSFNNCTFFSLNLLTTRDERSQAAHDIHTMLHPVVGSDGMICLFRFDDEAMLSFMGFGYRCILTDWFLPKDCAYLLERLNIANMPLEREVDYFADMVYMLAKEYYLHSQPSMYDILPVDFISNAGLDGVDREGIDKLVDYELTTPQRRYGNGYVEYDESIISMKEDVSAELDLMLLEMDDDDDSPFDEEIESENEYRDEDEFFDEEAEETERDIYEFDDVDPEIFRDPAIMVKWLNRADKRQNTDSSS